MLNTQDLKDIFDCLDIEDQKSWVERMTQNFFIPESGRYWSLLRVPFFKFILDKLDDPEVEQIGLMCTSQIGKSIFLCGIAIEWALKYPGENVLFYCPDNSNAKMFMEKKMLPSIFASNEYLKYIPKCDNGEIDKSKITKNLIQFTNGSTIEVLGIASHNATVSRTCSLVIADEFSSAKTLRKNGGDLLSLISRRLTAKSYNPHKLILASTPLKPNQDIHKFWSESKQYEWGFKCPHCNEFQSYDFRQLKWTSDKTITQSELSDSILSGKKDVHYLCPHCKQKIYESDKVKLLSEGKELIVGNANINKNIALRLNGLYSLERWEKYASDFVQTKDNIKNLMEFNTQVLCEPWNPFGSDRSIDKKTFEYGNYKKGTIPEDTYKLIAGIDVQENRFYYTVYAITKNKKISLIDWGMPDFDITDPFNQDSLPYLMYNRSYGGQRISKIIIDVGYNQHVLMKICREIGAIPLKGRPKAKHANQYLYKLNDPEIRFCPLQESNKLLDTIIIQKTLQLPQDIDQNDEIFEHFFNVIEKKEVYQDKFDGARRDYRDATRYAISYIYSQNLIQEMDRIEYQKQNIDVIKNKAKQNAANIANLFGG